MELVNKRKVETKLDINRKKIKRIFLGMTFTDGLLYKLFIYTLLVGIGFVYLYPLLYMLSYSLKDLSDLINPMVEWIPTKFYGVNYKLAYQVLDYLKTLRISLSVTLIPAILQTLSTALIGYGLAKFPIPFKNVILIIILSTFIIPRQVVMIPTYVMFNQYKLLGSPLAIILPSLLGQGVNSAIFILIFFQFFRMIPKSIDEAAQIDGAGPLYIFWRISIPLALPAFITSFLFSFVWYWNETYVSSLLLAGKVSTLHFRLFNFLETFRAMYGQTETMINEGIRMAAMIYIILPVLLVYFIFQRWFIEGIDRSGITGE